MKAVGVTEVLVAVKGPTLCVTVEPGCTVVVLPIGCPGVVTVPPSRMVFWRKNSQNPVRRVRNLILFTEEDFRWFRTGINWPNSWIYANI